jgi:hypothetical protein
MDIVYRLFSARMEKLRRLCLGGAALLLMAGLLAPQSAQATHFRGMYVYAIPTENPNEVRIVAVQFWRYSQYGSDFDNLDGGEPAIGDMVSSPGGLELGDGSSYGGKWEVTAFDDSEDWVVIRAEFTHQYSSSGTYEVGLDGCCRISALENGWNNEDYEVSSEILVDGENESATTSSGPFVGVPQGPNVTYQIPFTNPDNDKLRFKLATPADAGVSSGSNPSGLSINSTTGEITWDNSSLTAGTLHALQVIIEEYDQEDDPATADPKATVVSDFIFRIGSEGNDQPVCTLDPENTSVVAGNEVSIDVTGTDTEGDADDDGPDENNTVRISALSLPGGSLNPNPQEGTSPQTATFTWTPSSPGTYNATFSIGDGLITTTCTATIDVTQAPTCDTPTLGPERIDRSANTVSNTITDNEGIQVFEFTVLQNFTVASISPSVGFNRVPNTDAYRWVGSGPPPTKVDFTLQAGASGQGTYFLEATDACPAGSKTLVADPVYDLGPSERQFRLAGPNPFRNQTTIEIGVPEQMSVSLSVYNLVGQKVATLVDDTKTTGMHTVRWDGQSGSGQALASGLYLLRLQADDWTATRRVTIVR